MGSGIAQAAAQSGFHTILYELNESVLEKAKKGMYQNLESLVAKGRITEEWMAGVINRIRFTNDLQDCLADIIIEAIGEKTELKIALFNQLAELNHSEVIFASNTSSLSIRRIAEGVQKPERVIGMHFFNPATIMKLVEVVSTPLTNNHTTETVVELTRAMGKIPVMCTDAPGFIVNRVARPFYIESLRLAEEGKIDIEQIDRLMEATGFKLGPFRLMDLIGNDINYAVSCSVYEQLDLPERLKPSYLQEQKVKEGKLGKKTGEGFYRYP
jgi:3-hydroxybutyryl-CoA dehydrogenase